MAGPLAPARLVPSTSTGPHTDGAGGKVAGPAEHARGVHHDNCLIEILPKTCHGRSDEEQSHIPLGYMEEEEPTTVGTTPGRNPTTFSPLGNAIQDLDVEVREERSKEVVALAAPLVDIRCNQCMASHRIEEPPFNGHSGKFIEGSVNWAEPGIPR